MRSFSVAGLNIAIEAPEWTLNNRLYSFEKDIIAQDSSYDIYNIRCEVTFGASPVLTEENAKLLVKRNRIHIYEHMGDCYWLFKSNLKESESNITFKLSGDRSDCVIYLPDKYSCVTDITLIHDIRDVVLYALRNSAISALALNRGIMLHASSVIWQGKGLLFSAPSGTGKTTHTHIWRDNYNSEILDGDVTALRISDAGISAFGLPWCGTSGEYMNKRVPLRSVVFLKQAESNKIRELKPGEAFACMVSRCFLPKWSKSLTEKVMDTISSVAENIKCYELKCLPDTGAAELVRRCLEKH